MQRVAGHAERTSQGSQPSGRGEETWDGTTLYTGFGPGLHADSPVYWFMMQIGMVVGFATSFPMNWWLLKHGFKERM